MTDIAELRSLQREYIENRDYWNGRIQQQQRHLSNLEYLSPGLLAECRKQADQYRARAALEQKRIDAIQAKLDEAIGL